MHELLAAAEQVVRDAGSKAKSMIHGAQVRRRKPFGDIVTDGDLLVEESVIGALGGLFPDHGFDSEECGPQHADREYVWVLDPIDGSKYYARDVPLYSVSLALKRRGIPVLGVVYCPEMDRMYCAAEGHGATLNGRAIHCSAVDRLEDASIYVELPSGAASADELQSAMQTMSELVERTYRVRAMGVGSLGLAFCAAGGFDTYVNLGSAWKECDVVAGRVLVQEAGGDWCQTDRRIVAGPATLCRRVRELLDV